MAEFCKECAEEMQFEPDFVGLITPERVAEGFGAFVLCEGCGPILVDHEGKRIERLKEKSSGPL